MSSQKSFKCPECGAIGQLAETADCATVVTPVDIMPDGSAVARYDAAVDEMRCRSAASAVESVKQVAELRIDAHIFGRWHIEVRIPSKGEICVLKDGLRMGALSGAAKDACSNLMAELERCRRQIEEAAL